MSGHDAHGHAGPTEGGDIAAIKNTMNTLLTPHGQEAKHSILERVSKMTGDVWTAVKSVTATTVGLPGKVLVAGLALPTNALLWSGQQFSRILTMTDNFNERMMNVIEHPAKAFEGSGGGGGHGHGDGHH